MAKFLKHRCPKWALELDTLAASKGDKNVETSGLLSSAADEQFQKPNLCDGLYAVGCSDLQSHHNLRT